MRTAFNDVRRRLMPKVTEQLYASAKLAFDRKEYDLAATQFSDLLTFLEDGDTRELPSLKEFRTLATGFRDLSQVAVATAPKPAAAPAAEPIAQVSPAGQTAGAFNVPAATANTGAGPASGTLEPPVVIRQQMPLWLGMRDFLPRGNRGTLRVIIDERGNVEEARVIESLHMVYDALLISATRTWKYEPAKLDGKPVRYVKMIEVVLKPQ
jgi:hypothetical protein